MALLIERGKPNAAIVATVGRRDRCYCRDLFEQTSQLIPNSNLYVRPRRGHLTVTLDPKAVATIQGFFAR